MDHVLLIIPVYNGERYLKKTFSQLEQLQHNRSKKLKIVFVNDGSNDATAALLQNYTGPLQDSFSVIILEKNHGKGYAIREAIREFGSGSEIICFTDVDIPYGIPSLEQVINNCVQTDIVVGSRIMDDEHKQYSGYRYIANRIFRLFIPKQIREIRDTQCGLKAFKSSVAEDVFNSLQTFRWTFDLEIFVIAQLRGYTIEEVPVMISASSIEKRGGVSFVKDGWRIFKDMWRIRRNIRCHRYEK